MRICLFERDRARGRGGTGSLLIKESKRGKEGQGEIVRRREVERGRERKGEAEGWRDKENGVDGGR